HFSLPSHTESAFTASSGFKNWKNAIFKDGVLAAHSQTEHNRDAESIIGNINKEYNKKFKYNWDYIKTLDEVLLYTATENIGQRGHNETIKSDRKGNFLGILELIAKHNPNIMKKINAVGNAKYTSVDIQNEILSCLAEMLRTSIIKAVKKSEMFSILPDEAKTIAKKSRFLLYVLEYKSNLVGQSYDGATVMSGKHRGVQTRVKQLYVFMSGSVVHQNWLQIQGEMYPGAPRELQWLSNTWWACTYLACRNLVDRLPAVVQVLEDIGTLKKLFGDAKFLSDMFQSSYLDLAKAVYIVKAFICTFKNYGNEQVFDDFWTTVLGIAEQCNFRTETVPRHKKKLSSKLQATSVISTVESQAALNSKECFRAGIFYQVLDMMLNELRTRFSEQ
ncbi:zinc finger MYM-type protein 1-like, partial [Scleropages formosus]